jgi:transcriptional regulator with XRE-family HTH domain
VIGERLRKQRQHGLLSQGQVAKACGMTATRLNEIEWDRGEKPTNEELGKLYLALAVLSGRAVNENAKGKL